MVSPDIRYPANGDMADLTGKDLGDIVVLGRDDLYLFKTWNKDGIS